MEVRSLEGTKKYSASMAGFERKVTKLGENGFLRHVLPQQRPASLLVLQQRAAMSP